jgi:hypothetical protein
MIEEGRIPISKKNVQLVKPEEDKSGKAVMSRYSKDAGLVIVGFRGSELNEHKEEIFKGFDELGDVLFVHSHYQLSMD